MSDTPLPLPADRQATAKRLREIAADLSQAVKNLNAALKDDLPWASTVGLAFTTVEVLQRRFDAMLEYYHAFSQSAPAPSDPARAWRNP